MVEHVEIVVVGGRSSMWWVRRRGGGGADEGGGGPARLHRAHYGLGRLAEQRLAVAAFRRHRITSGVLRLHSIRSSCAIVHLSLVVAQARNRATTER